MKKTRTLIFISLILIYAVGIFVGAIREIKTPKQAELYEYLGSSVSGYSTNIKEGIKSVASDNVKSLALMIVGALFKPLCFLVAAVLCVKGYFTGFSVMAALRLYGIKGLLLCGANIISSAVMIPAAAYFGCVVIDEMFVSTGSVSEIRKKMFVMSVFLFAIFCADSFAKGCLTSIFMNWASKLV